MDGSPVTVYTEGLNGALIVCEAACCKGSGGNDGACLKRIRSFVPLEYRTEMVQLVKLAGPVVRMGRSAFPVVQDWKAAVEEVAYIMYLSKCSNSAV